MTYVRDWMEWALGILLGLSLGLAISWGIAPNARLDASPAGLRSEYKEEYRLLVASAFQATGDLGRAQTRLSLLQETDSVQALIDQALRLRSGQIHSILFPGNPEQVVYALAYLANAIQQSPDIVEITPETISPTSVLPAITYSPFELVFQESVCPENPSGSLAMIQVRNTLGQPLPGVEIRVTWEDGQQRFYTGLKPELGIGYADFIMTPGVQYSLQLQPSSIIISDLSAPDCTADDGTVYQGGLLLIFEQP